MAQVTKNKTGAKKVGQLKKEVRQNATITTQINDAWVEDNGDDITFDFAAALSGAEDTELDSIVAGHTPGSDVIDAYTANVTLHEEDMMPVITGDGAITITLPPAANFKETWVTFVNVSTGNNTLTIDGNGTEKINAASTVALGRDESITIMSDGTEWRSNAKEVIPKSQDTMIKSQATTSTTWVSWGCFSYDPAYVTLAAMQAVAWKSVNGATAHKGDIRLYDVDNSQVICSINNIGDTSKALQADNNAANLPTGSPAMFEVQFQIDDSASELTIESITLIFG